MVETKLKNDDKNIHIYLFYLLMYAMNYSSEICVIKSESYSGFIIFVN